jgi:hypothetical protein
MNARCYVGLDLGQATDFSALVVLRTLLAEPAVTSDSCAPLYEVPHLQRFPRGMAYPKLVASVLGLLATPALQGSVLVVDRTGVGRAVTDMLTASVHAGTSCSVCAVTITSGQAVKRADAGGLQVPKKDLVLALEGLVRGHRLSIASSLPTAPVLIRELGSFRRTMSKHGRLAFGASGKGHDDLVLALALAGWVAEMTRRSELVLFPQEGFRTRA